MKELIDDLKKALSEKEVALRKYNETVEEVESCKQSIKNTLYGLEDASPDKYMLPEGQHTYDFGGELISITVDEGEITHLEPFRAIKINMSIKKEKS
ncbi:hypothetical protein [uncultured Sunxiuqinia sp.]|uniref:hypothetical protein n=1 Tax=uncultured Sunxiuqinia sp. TaxID=1573825 RepID=UPI00263A2650|nr:hypothetical protein [uncultured Sunxiuqinia sp.]